MRWRRGTRKRQSFIAHYTFPTGVGEGLSSKYSGVEDIGTAVWGLRQWPRIHAAVQMPMGMPSRSVGLVCHDFILHTEEYKRFCQRAYGKLLHHEPSSSMSSDQVHDLNGPAMAATFALACLDQRINPALPSRLPVLPADLPARLWRSKAGGALGPDYGVPSTDGTGTFGHGGGHGCGGHG
jgi:hypothetical protein